MKEQICYKVTNLHSESAITAGQYRLYYLLGKITYPKIGKIFVFENLHNAQNFACRTDKIYKGIASSLEHLERACDVSKEKDFCTWWKDRTKTRSQLVPNGTFIVEYFHAKEEIIR